MKENTQQTVQATHPVLLNYDAGVTLWQQNYMPVLICRGQELKWGMHKRAA
jgi:hypothetical protein